MKYILTISISILTLLSLNGQSLKTENYIARERLPDWFRSQIDRLDFGGDYYVDEQMNPMYFEADFNGEGQPDIAIFIYERSSNKKGILLYHRENGGKYVLRAGKTFNKRDSFGGIEIWKLYRKKIANQTTFAANGDIEGSIPVTLTNIAIEVSASEASSNLITWNGKEYVWIHSGE